MNVDVQPSTMIALSSLSVDPEIFNIRYENKLFNVLYFGTIFMPRVYDSLVSLLLLSLSLPFAADSSRYSYSSVSLSLP